MRLHLIPNQLAVVIYISRNRAVKLWRGAGARRQIFVRDTVDWLSEPVIIHWRRPFSRTRTGIEAEHWIVAGVGLTPDLCLALGLCSRFSCETGFLGLRGSRRGY